MSHEATNWAIRQRGLKPSAKLVLWHLCDRYHPDNGCFPAQETLANDCEISRAGLNNQLEELEEAGLIRRETRHDQATKRQKSTLYRFAFEADFRVQNLDTDGAKAVSRNDAEPCPKNSESRVQNLDTNSVREPVREPVNLRESAGADAEVLEKQEGQDAGQGAAEDGGEALRGSGKAAFKAAHASWPTFTTDSTPEAEKAWFALSPAERVKAADEAQRYVAAAQATGRKLVCSFGVYLREKRWEKLAAPDAPAARLSEPPFGPAWCAERIARILAVRPVVWQPKAYQRQMLAEGKIDEAAETRAANLAARAWALGLMDEQAAKGNGAACTPESIAAGKAYGKVERDSALWQAWQAAFAAQGWPWLPDMGKHWGAYFPAEGPDGFFAQS